MVGVLEGAGSLANETIVIGAHYDHLGRGTRGDGEIHNGADDNASGTSGIMEIARRLDRRIKRSLVAALCSWRLPAKNWGSSAVRITSRSPAFPLETTVAMINLDMIGRLQDSKLTIGGTGSAAEFDAMIEELNQTYSFKIAKMANGLGPSDHATFYRQKVPVLFFYTGDHPDYHKPTDDVDRINVDGMVAIVDFVTDIVSRLDDAATRPSYRETTRGRRNPAGGGAALSGVCAGRESASGRGRRTECGGRQSRGPGGASRRGRRGEVGGPRRSARWRI